jgi:hypothetical protein
MYRSQYAFSLPPSTVAEAISDLHISQLVDDIQSDVGGTSDDMDRLHD